MSDQRKWLHRDGTSQQQRRLPALDPDSAPIDERDVQTFLVFAHEFAHRVRYWDADGKPGTWEAFFACDASAIIAAIERTNPLPLRNAVKEILAGPKHAGSLARLFDLITELSRKLDDWAGAVGTTTDFRHDIRKRIRANLPAVLRRLANYALAASNKFDAVSALDLGEFCEDAWSIGLWQPEADDSLFGGSGSEQQQVSAAMLNLEPLFIDLYNVLLEVIALAPGYFEADLSGRSDHEPHFALFVAFLRLFLQVRDDSNTLTRKHLDFFFEDVLGIKPRPSVPDHLHVIVELAKQVQKGHLLAANIELDAGADDAGGALRYTVDKDLVANKAQIEELRTVFVNYESEAEALTPAPRIQNIHAAPIANSQDGLGADIEDSERPSWKTFGGAAMPQATLGFALASRELLLAEGKRVITLIVEVENIVSDVTEKDLSKALDVELSGEAEWILPDEFTATLINDGPNGEDPPVQTGRLTVHITLEKTTDAVTFANAEILGQDLGTSLPLLKVTLHPLEPTGESFAYEFLKNLNIKALTMKTAVTGLTSVIVQNDEFAMDPAKPFVPFGTSPRFGSNFYIGSTEAFQKNLSSLSINLTWDQLPNSSFEVHYEGYYDLDPITFSTDAFSVTAQLIQDGESISLALTKDTLFSSKADKLPEPDRVLELKQLNDQQPRVIDQLSEWTPATQHGFVRLQLGSQDFFHDAYVSTLTRQAIAASRMEKCTAGAQYRFREKAGDTKYKIDYCSAELDPAKDEAILPNEPYTPTIKAFSVDYEASATSSTGNALELFHLVPFGNYEVVIPDGETRPRLLPTLEHQGSLYIGVRDLQPLQSLSLLFQVAEGTADTEVRRPDVQWSYLAGSTWTDFEEHEVVADATRGLIASGVITFSIPRNVTSTHRLMPDGLSWLRAQVETDADGVSELINVHTQAVRATFEGQGNDPGFLAQPLEAGSVSGPVLPDTNIAGITQPYDSFGGRTAESGLDFYTRVAEHLRHKGRAVTLFDYERLVLQNFPGIYKVKCINHTNQDHMVAPGHVLIAVIPDFTKLKAVDRRRPKVSLDQLDRITTFLQSLNCPFARNDRTGSRLRLLVSNPIYEDIQVAFNVRFQPEVNTVDFHKRKLNDAINEFLSPWGYEDGAEISFGGKVYKSSILNFVEKQPYVDYVTDFVMTHGDGTEDLNAIEVDTPRSILVPVATHAGIKHLSDSACPLVRPIPRQNYIGYLTIDADFELGASEEAGS